ncbi:MAG: holo-[acyl-carrier-protein] synthase [Acidimicrobiales bacterium]|nr:MAG: holo-[acyl-carrier-protein] synthase [Acidimicrobiales bacterium]
MEAVVAVGTDLVDVERLDRVIARRPGLLERIFTDREVSHARRWRNPTERLAARWAAKESVLKALGLGVFAVPLREVEVVNSPVGAPSIMLHGKAAEIAKGKGITRWCVSLTHTDRFASAVVLALTGEGDVSPLPLGETVGPRGGRQ